MRGPAGGARFAAFSYNHIACRLGDVKHDAGYIPLKPERVHLAIVHTGEELLGFRDGKLFARKKTIGRDLGPGTGRILIGKAQIGKYEMLRLSTTARYDSDFTPQTRFTPDKHTLALYHFDKDSGDVLKDASDNGHDGKIIGAKWVEKNRSGANPSQRSTSERVSLGTSLRFSDPADEVTIPTLKDDTDALTIELWLQRDPFQTDLGQHICYSAAIGSRIF